MAVVPEGRGPGREGGGEREEMHSHYHCAALNRHILFKHLPGLDSTQAPSPRRGRSIPA